MYGFPAGAQLAEIIRQGTNDFVCLADTPGDQTFRVSCYHASLDRFMVMGRELRARGLGLSDVIQARGDAIADGTLSIPQNAVMYSLTGIGSLDAATGLPDSVRLLTVLYVPWATAESTGLPTRPPAAGALGRPWLMQEGMHRAHIMISGSVTEFELAGQSSR